jgi:hypothetical protein
MNSFVLNLLLLLLLLLLLVLPFRYLSEDLPFGLVPMKGVAELLGVPATPWFDRVITWGQQLIGKVRTACTGTYPVCRTSSSMSMWN